MVKIINPVFFKKQLMKSSLIKHLNFLRVSHNHCSNDLTLQAPRLCLKIRPQWADDGATVPSSKGELRLIMR